MTTESDPNQTEAKPANLKSGFEEVGQVGMGGGWFEIFQVFDRNLIAVREYDRIDPPPK